MNKNYLIKILSSQWSQELLQANCYLREIISFGDWGQSDTRCASFDIKFTRQGFEKACWQKTQTWYSIYQMSSWFNLQTSD